ncbi:hypothetical protein SCHPADRAFT_376968 [Schizopora paradoxa]|uniref:N-acetyltransferase domain-containing protein n=1 Tax=Schizopora paradoxa TaxID=27342 RepID=A0A0H2RMV3_9AGAM|nr:hypothetical protein SCHPADRAFT_376968 [Schizopora paradoxa]
MQTPEQTIRVPCDGVQDLPWCNSYTNTRPALPTDELYGPTPYDVNFCLPYDPKYLETDQVRLVPFIPRLHAQAFFQHAQSYPEDFRYMRYSPPKSLKEVLEFFELEYRRDPGKMAFVAVDKLTGAIGGIVTLADCDAVNLRAAISMGFAFRAYRGTFGAALSAALLLRYCLNLPSDPVAPGLGLRRVTWSSHTDNFKSLMLARALGFRLESERRWERTITPEKLGNDRPIRSDDGCERRGADDNVLVICFDEWEAGVKQIISGALATMRYEAKL